MHIDQTMKDSPLYNILVDYRNAAQTELTEILDWWTYHMVDEPNGGFFGELNNQNQVVQSASKGIVLNSRILWSFSAGYLFYHKEIYKNIAQRAYHYIIENFFDTDFGGVYWSVDQYGKMHDGKKQIYGLAFCIYGLTEYYKISGDQNALNHAIGLYRLIEKYSYDEKYGGYIEAMSRNWQPADDLRLSEKDDNEKKSMNTHLHIIESYSNLYIVWNDEGLRNKIAALLDNFDQHIINKSSYHLNLFFNDAWTVRSSIISYGHDIEAAWLLHESAEIIGDNERIGKFRDLSIKMAMAAEEGLDEKDRSLNYEYDAATGHYVNEKHWWPQAEAMVGFMNAYQITRNEKFLNYSIGAFHYIQNKLKDVEHGEWFWGLAEEGAIMNKEKAGFWKCPYHNSRACMEIVKRIENLA